MSKSGRDDVSAFFALHIYEKTMEVFTMEKEIREKYRLKRLGKRIRLRELSDYIGCHIGSISHYENGRYGMSEDKISKYKEFIDTHEGSESN